MYSWKNYFIIQADYQHWANEVMFKSLDLLTPDAIDSDQGLFFQSIHHTVDHILQVSRSWLARLQGEPLSVNYREISHPDWRELKNALRHETRRLQNWLEDRPDEFFDGQVTFTGGDGKERSMWVRDALSHLFTHFAHHRGQVSAVATRLGAPCPEMDFVYYRREMERLLAEVKNGQAGPTGA
jgi:uncharacterized damage-inducible protein DinB